MSSESGSIRRYIVSHKLTKDRPTSRCLSHGAGRVIDVSAVTNTACASERLQELLIGLKRQKLRKHPRIGRWAKWCINRYFRSCGRQTVTSDRRCRLIHESSSSWRRPVAEVQLLNQTRRDVLSMRRSGINPMSSAITRTARAIHNEPTGLQGQTRAQLIPVQER